MASKKKKPAAETARVSAADLHVKGLKSEVQEQPITDTLKYNYMPYAMSVIVSRAIPEIDGFKPTTGSCCTPCTRCTCWAGPVPRAPIL